jgi:hypothetical protein
MAKRVRYSPGDVVAIPLGGGHRAIARVYRDVTIAVYRATPKETARLEEVRDQGILFFAAVFDAAIRDGSWPVVGRFPFENEEEAWPPPRFIQDALNPEKYRIYERGEIRSAKAEEVRGLEKAVVYKPDQLIARIQEELGLSSE